MCTHHLAMTARRTAIQCYTMQHGAGEKEADWAKQGHENFIMDNLIAGGKAVPMIIVNENGTSQLPPPNRGGGSTTPMTLDVRNLFMAAPYTEFDTVMTKDLIPYIDTNFRTIAGCNHRALAGLSMAERRRLKSARIIRTHFPDWGSSV